MKVWLVNPPVQRGTGRGTPAVVGSLFYNSPPLGLASLAAVLERAGHAVVVTDCAVEGLGVRALVERGRTLRPDLIGLTATTSYVDLAVAAAEGLCEALPGVPRCIGGPHVTANPELLLEESAFDFAVLGEGEVTLIEAVEALEAGRPVDDLPGIAVARDGDLHLGPPRPLIADLDTLPLPARHLLPIHRYRPMPNDVRDTPKTSAIASRGCPFRCSFCDKSTFGDTWRSRGPARMVEEMHHLHDRWGIRDVAWVDSTFTPNRARVEAVLDALERDPPPVTWTASCRADVLDEALLRRMRDAGCWRIRVAIESGNERILAGIRKGVALERFAWVVRTAAALGIQVKGFFMVGHVGETPETVEDSIRFALSLPLRDVTVQINTPLRGTPQWEICRDHGTLLTRDPRHYSFFEPVFVPRGMTARGLLDAQRSFYARFYLRPETLLRHARSVRGPSDLCRYVDALPLLAALTVPKRSSVDRGVDQPDRGT